MKKLFLLLCTPLLLMLIGCENVYMTLDSESGSVENNCGTFNVFFGHTDFYVGTDSSNTCRRSRAVLSFDTSSIENPEVIQGARLVFRITRTGSNDINTTYLERYLKIYIANANGIGGSHALDVNDFNPLYSLPYQIIPTTFEVWGHDGRYNQWVDVRVPISATIARNWVHTGPGARTQFLFLFDDYLNPERYSIVIQNAGSYEKPILYLDIPE